MQLGRRKLLFFFFKYTKEIEYRLQTIISVFCKSNRVLSLLGLLEESLKEVNQIQLLHLLGMKNDAEIIYLAGIISPQWLSFSFKVFSFSFTLLCVLEPWYSDVGSWPVPHTAPGSLLEMQSHKPHPRPVGPASAFNKMPSGFINV